MATISGNYIKAIEKAFPELLEEERIAIMSVAMRMKENLQGNNELIESMTKVLWVYKANNRLMAKYSDNNKMIEIKLAKIMGLSDYDVEPNYDFKIDNEEILKYGNEYANSLDSKLNDKFGYVDLYAAVRKHLLNNQDRHFKSLKDVVVEVLQQYPVYLLKDMAKNVSNILGITQVQLADMLGVPYSTMQRWNSGDIPKMARLALDLLVENKKLKDKIINTEKGIK